MPRPTPASSAIRTPLDYILGTRGAVSVLRELHATQVPLSQAELARRAAMHLRGLPAILNGLEVAGVVSYVGRGRTRQVQLHHLHPLAQLLRQLFQAEAVRWNAVQQRLREIVHAEHARVLAAWIEGPVATGDDRFTDPILVGILSEAPLPTAAQEGIRQQSNGLQSQQHVIIALHFYQRADLLRFTAERRSALERAILIHGPAPLDLLGVPAKPGKTPRGGAPRAETAVALPPPRPREIARAVAAKLIRDPEIVARAREFLDRRLALAGDAERLTLLEWKGLLDSLTAGQLAALLREDSERADRLRQSLPFVGVLTDAERAALFSPPRTPRAPRRKGTRTART